MINDYLRMNINDVQISNEEDLSGYSLMMYDNHSGKYIHASMFLDQAFFVDMEWILSPSSRRDECIKRAKAYCALYDHIWRQNECLEVAIEARFGQHTSPNKLTDDEMVELAIKSDDHVIALSSLLSPKTKAALKAKNIYFVRQVQNMTRADLLKIPNLGSKGVDEIESVLMDVFGWKLCPGTNE